METTIASTSSDPITAAAILESLRQRSDAYLIGIAGIPGSVLQERAILNAGTATKAAFCELQHDGITLVLDGCGNSRVGVHHLVEFPVTAIKLHMTFVQGVTTSATDRSVVRSMVSTAHALGFAVTAVGVETPEQAAILNDLGCDYLQGFLFGKPMAAVEAELLLPTFD